MILRPELAARVFNTPLLMHPGKLDAALAVIGERIVEGGIVLQGAGERIDHVAFETGRPLAGRIGDKVGRMLDDTNRQPFAILDGVAIIPIEGTLVHKGAYVVAYSGRTSYEGLQAQVLRAMRNHSPRCAVRVGSTRRIPAGPHRQEADGFGEDAIKLALPRCPRLRESRHDVRSIGSDGKGFATMTTSKMIAGLIGPTLAAIALALLLKFDNFPALAEQVSRDTALILLSGVLLFIAGLAIVRVHNLWTGGWPVLVTVLGWLAIIGGLLRMFFPSRLAAIAGSVAHSTGLIIGMAIVLLLIGAFLSFKAYSRD